MFRRRRDVRAALNYQRRRNSKGNTILFLLSVIFGLYLINFKFTLFAVPDFLTPIQEWILTLAGLILIYSGLRFLFNKR